MISTPHTTNRPPARPAPSQVSGGGSAGGIANFPLLALAEMVAERLTACHDVEQASAHWSDWDEHRQEFVEIEIVGRRFPKSPIALNGFWLDAIRSFGLRVNMIEFSAPNNWAVLVEVQP